MLCCFFRCSAASHLAAIPKTSVYCLSGPPPNLVSFLCISQWIFRSSSSCCFFRSVPISRSLKYPGSPRFRHAPFSIQNFLPWVALGFHSPPPCASQLILMSTLPCLHIFSKLFGSSSIILHLPPLVEAAASCSNMSLLI